MTFHIMLPFFQGTLTAVLLLFVARQRPRSAETRVFSLFLGSMSLWGIFIGVMRATGDHAIALYWERAALMMIALTSVSFYLFSVRYARLSTRFPDVLATLFVVVSAAIAPTAYFVRGIGEDRYGNAPVWGVAFYPWMVIIYLLIILAAINLDRSRQRSPSYEIRNRHSYLILGAALCLLGGFFDVLPALGVSVYPGTIIGNIGFAVLTSAAIMRYHLFDIQVVLTSGLAYALTGALVAVPVGLAGALWVAFAGLRNFNRVGTYLPLVLLVLCVPPLWNLGERIVTRRIRREKYAHLKALDELSRGKGATNDLEQLCKWIVGLLDGAVAPVFLYFFVKKEDGNYSLVAESGAGKAASDMRLDASHPLVELLRSDRRVYWQRELNIHPQLQAMSQQERSALKEVNAELYLPVGITDLVGILALGAKPLGRLYSREDMEFLNALVSQAGLMLENIRLFNQERAQRERIELFNSERATFLDALAHEMKTPLTSAISSAELLASELSSRPGMLSTLADDVESSVNNLGRLVNDVLDFGKMQQARVRFDLQPVELGKLISVVQTESAFALKTKQQDLSVQVPQDPTWVCADSMRVKQILHNLIGNAGKFSPFKQTIQLRVVRRDRDVKIEVEDRADLIPVEERDHIFAPYYRGKAAQQKHIPGLGLGLFVCRQLVEGQQGKIWIESGKSQGNVFCFSLPLEDGYEDTDN